jgi:diguanylate cyclase (GGDEF)-like protein
LFIDLDGFKAVNDSAGHDVGDELLWLVAARLANVLDEDALLARFGSDEFAAAIWIDDDPWRASLVAAEVVPGWPTRSASDLS